MCLFNTDFTELGLIHWSSLFLPVLHHLQYIVIVRSDRIVIIFRAGVLSGCDMVAKRIMRPISTPAFGIAFMGMIALDFRRD